MLNKRDDENFEGHEESEYHFSDDDVTYEVETEAATPVKAPESTTKANILARLTRSRRMLISLVIFLVLVFIVYKMLTPGTTTPTTIAPPVISQQNVPTVTAEAPVPTAPANQQPQTQAAVPQTEVPQQSYQQPVQTVQTQPAPQMPTATTQPQPTVAQPVVQQPVAAPVIQPQLQPPPQPVQNVPTAYPQQPQVTIQQPPVQQPMPQQPVVGTTTTTTAHTEGQSYLPAVVPVQSTVSTNVGQMPVQTTTTVSTEADRLMAQVNAEQNQKLNEFATQNKAISDQVQALATRVANMEGQLNQIIQTLSHQNETRTPAPPPDAEITPPPSQSSNTDSRLSSYVVQAIIPGRAWLRAQNGETVTVAEGDQIRGLGRVVKIDPYNGVIEVNTGTRVVSLSYGNGGT